MEKAIFSFCLQKSKTFKSPFNATKHFVISKLNSL